VKEEEYNSFKEITLILYPINGSLKNDWVIIKLADTCITTTTHPTSDTTINMTVVKDDIILKISDFFSMTDRTSESFTNFRTRMLLNIDLHLLLIDFDLLRIAFLADRSS
jgi:hypothetical protein